MKTQNPTKAFGFTLRALKPVVMANVMALLAAISTVPAGTVHYVDGNNSSPTPPYTNWATAAITIQQAVDVSKVGDSVLVTNGVYAEGEGQAIDSNGNWSGPTRVVITNAISLRSINGPQFTIIDGQGMVRCAWLTDGASLSGFTLTNGRASFRGGGVSCASSNVFLTNCVIAGNSTPLNFGGGAYEGTLYNCTLASNSASRSGGGAFGSTLYNCLLTGNSVSGQWISLGLPPAYASGTGGGAGNCTLNNCALTGNSSTDYGGGAASSTLHNCLLRGNTARGGWRKNGTKRVYVPGTGSGVYGSTLYNCTLTGNSATDYGGGADRSALYNCIAYFNTASSGANYYTNSALNYCCTTPQPTNGFGNITNAPMFVNYAGGNLRLQSNSPCINAGNNAYVTSATDLDGNPRIVGGTVDIGAYEFPGAGSAISYAWLQQFGLPTDGSADAADLDGDGHTTWQEWRCQTCPTNAMSSLRLLPAAPAGTNLTVTWQSVARVNYFLERATNLASNPSFRRLATGLPGQAGATTYTDTNAASLTPLFYRVGVVP